MFRIEACAVATALLLAASLSAQDTTITTKTKVDADDAKIMVMTGCLQAGETQDTFLLSNATVITGDEVESMSKTEIDFDEDEKEVETRTETEVEREDDDEVVGTSGVRSYELAPRPGVDLTPHLGHKVEISALALDPKDGDDDAEVDIETETKVKVDDAPDSKAKSETELELPRGENARITVIAVKHLAPSCAQ